MAPPPLSAVQVADAPVSCMPGVMERALCGLDVAKEMASDVARRERVAGEEGLPREAAYSADGRDCAPASMVARHVPLVVRFN